MDWEDWFPKAVALRLDLDAGFLRVHHLMLYIEERLKDDWDESRFIEVSQCSTLLHHLGPDLSEETIICAI